MIFREDLRMSVRALVGRPAESLLLALGVALAIGATAAGLTLAGTTRAQSRELLALPRFREIVVATRADTSTMALPVRVRTATDVVLTVDDLERARSATEAVQYAYLSNPTVFFPGELKVPASTPDGLKPQLEYLLGLEVTPEFFAARGLTAAAGSLFTDEDVRRGEPVLVLGAHAGSTLFEDGRSLNRQVPSLSRLYRIIGVLAPTGTVEDEQAFTPARRLPRTDS